MNIEAITDEIPDYLSEADFPKRYFLPFPKIYFAIQFDHQSPLKISGEVVEIVIPADSRPVEHLLEKRGFMFADNRYVNPREFTYAVADSNQVEIISCKNIVQKALKKAKKAAKKLGKNIKSKAQQGWHELTKGAHKVNEWVKSHAGNGGGPIELWGFDFGPNKGGGPAAKHSSYNGRHSPGVIEGGNPAEGAITQTSPTNASSPQPHTPQQYHYQNPPPNYKEPIDFQNYHYRPWENPIIPGYEFPPSSGYNGFSYHQPQWNTPTPSQLNTHDLPPYQQFSNQATPPSNQPYYGSPSSHGAATMSDDTLIGSSGIGSSFLNDYYCIYASPIQELNLNSYQVHGELALSSGHYKQSIEDFGKAIEINPISPLPYLQRGVAYFSLGEYDLSMADYNQFATQSLAVSPPVSDFTLGVAKGLARGIYDSGRGMLLFLVDCIQHPVQTSVQLYDAATTLVQLARQDQWGVIAEALSPELHQLVTQWDTLSLEQRGELIAYASGKLGTDILMPGALAKVASRSLKSAQELAAVCRSFRIAEETLVLETAAEIGNTAKVAEVVRSGQTIMALGEDVGLTAREMAQLKQAGKLEGAINSGLEKLVSQSESEVLKSAINHNKHVKMARDYLDKPAKEVQKGINSYEKQIALHKDKIANPASHYPDWDKLDPRQREALINKKWPAEIQVFEEQRSVLQSILNERLSHE